MSVETGNVLVISMFITIIVVLNYVPYIIIRDSLPLDLQNWLDWYKWVEIVFFRIIPIPLIIVTSIIWIPTLIAFWIYG